MLRWIFSSFGALFSLISLGVIAGAFVLGAVFYLYSANLPSYTQLKQYSPKTISRIYSGEGKIIDEFAVERRLFTPVEEIPDLVKHAFISAEDKNFYIHNGYDPRGMVSAIVDAIKSGGQDIRGASTITQQVAKNFLLDGSRSGRKGFERKIRELILAPRLEATLGKDHVLELYLNEIDLGVRSFGVTAAAQSYFNKPLATLSPAEAAFLAVHPKNPYRYHPVKNRDIALKRRNFILEEMYENGYISSTEYGIALQDPMRTVQSGDFKSYRSQRPPRNYFTDEIRRQLSRDFGQDEFFTSGFAIRATLDHELQVAATLALQRGLENHDRSVKIWRGTKHQLSPEQLTPRSAWQTALRALPLSRDITLNGQWYPAVILNIEDKNMQIGIEGIQDTPQEPSIIPRKDIAWMKGDFFDNFEIGDVVYVRRIRDDSGAFIRWSLRQIPRVQGAFMAMDTNTGRVLALQGGFSYQHSVFNRATQAKRQPGSVLKPFVYAAALDSGYSPATIVVDSPIEINTPQGIWRPKNASKTFYGPTPLRTGIEKSRNLMTVRLAQEVGMDVVASYAERFGVYKRMLRTLSASLGSDETTLFKMVAAYAMFANGGERVEPTLVDRIQDRYGRTIYRHDQRICANCEHIALPRAEGLEIKSNRERVMDEVTAYQLTSMMQGVVTRGTARKTVNLPVPIAGKTGTTNDSKDVWFIGFSNNIVAGCFIGYDNPTTMDGASGGGTCGPVFNEFMTKALQRYKGGPFKTPEECQFIKINRLSGARMANDASGKDVVSECFRSGDEPTFGVTFDGGFQISSDLPLVEEVAQVTKQTTSASGQTATVGPNASFGTLSSGGLY